jgi:hypothetical protein
LSVGTNLPTSILIMLKGNKTKKHLEPKHHIVYCKSVKTEKMTLKFGVNCPRHKRPVRLDEHRYILAKLKIYNP